MSVLNELNVFQNQNIIIKEAIDIGNRMDGRQALDFRNLEIVFGKDYGQANITIGKTKYDFIIIQFLF